MALVVRTDQDPRALISATLEAIRSVDAEQPVYDVRTMEDVVERSTAQRWLNMMMVTVFAAIALLLASVGVYGVVAYGVNERRREFGIRLALGAERGAVARLVVWQGTVLAILGSAIGFVAAVFVAKAIESLLYGIRASDPPSFATAVGLLVSVALFAAICRPAAPLPSIPQLRCEVSRASQGSGLQRAACVVSASVSVFNAGRRTRFHHMIAPVTNNMAGTSPRIT